MRRWVEVLALVLSDGVATLLAWSVALYLKWSMNPEALFPLHVYVAPAIGVASVWVGLFWYVGLYGDWGVRSRADELVWVLKVVFFGGLVLFLVTFDPAHPFPASRVVLVGYGATLIGGVGAGRLIIRAIQRHLYARGFNLRPTVIVGVGDKALQLADTIERYPRLGYRLEGFISSNGGGRPEHDAPILGNAHDVPALVAEHGIVEVMFAAPDLSHEEVLTVVSGCKPRAARFSVVPDLYDVILGRASGLGQLFGAPIMPLFPNRMPIWQERTKRVIDVLTAIVGLTVGMPVWLGVAALIWLEDHGPIFYSQERAGKESRPILVHKFRSMVTDAEKLSGPQWASKDDPRITRIGRVIRKIRFDEVPQLWNVLKGEMSMVGPRPERPYFVDQLAEDIPLYRFRLHVKPGLTGWAQTKQAYDTSIDDVREKLKYDLYYIENMSLRFDLLILLRTVWVVLTGKGAQ